MVSSAARELLENAAISAAVIEIVAAGIVVHAPDGAIAYANAAACEMSGLTQDQMRGRTSIDPRWGAVHADGSPFPGEEHPAMVTLRTGEPCADVIMGVDAPGSVRRWISGYPAGLVGDEISLGARIIAVADVVESMASPRPYRPGLGIDAALGEIEEHRGVLYDADVVDACLRLFREKGCTIDEAAAIA